MSRKPLYGERAVELLRELQRADAENGFIPQYNEERIRLVIDEVKDLHDTIQQLLELRRKSENQNELIVSLNVHHHAVLRNKRILLAYLNSRLRKIIGLRWGAAAPPDPEKVMSAEEKDFRSGYDQLLNEYTEAVGIDVLTDLEPPKDLLVEVRVVKSAGEVATECGSVKLEQGSQLYLRRGDAQQLIQQGLVEPAHR
eukprot:tig00021234_g19399.t1